MAPDHVASRLDDRRAAAPRPDDPVLALALAPGGAVRPAGARDRRAPVCTGGDGAGRRRHLGRDRPLGRLADGRDQRAVGQVHGRHEPSRGAALRARARRARCPHGCVHGHADRRHADHRHRRHPGDALRLGRRRPAHSRDSRRRRAAGVPRPRPRHDGDDVAADAVPHPRGGVRPDLAAATPGPAGTRPLRGRLQAQRGLPQRRQRRPGARQRVRARRCLRRPGRARPDGDLGARRPQCGHDLHAEQRRGGRARRRVPRGRHRRPDRADRGSHDPHAGEDDPDPAGDRPELRAGLPGADHHRRRHARVRRQRSRS